MERFKVKLIQLTQLLKYLTVGGIATLCNYLIFITLITYANIHYLIASFIGYVTSVLLGFSMNKKWTFNSTFSGKEVLIKYCLVYLSTLGLGILLLHVFVEWFLLMPQLANIFTLALSAGINFIGLKWMVFKRI